MSRGVANIFVAPSPPPTVGTVRLNFFSPSRDDCPTWIPLRVYLNYFNNLAQKECALSVGLNANGYVKRRRANRQKKKKNIKKITIM